jgi:hypothetical protein
MVVVVLVVVVVVVVLVLVVAVVVVVQYRYPALIEMAGGICNNNNIVPRTGVADTCQTHYGQTGPTLHA